MRRTYPLAVICTLLLLIAFGNVPAIAGNSAVSTKLKTERVDLNRASVAQLSALPGIGEQKARAIIDYRSKNGHFSTVEDLLQVKGVGEKLLEKIKHHVIVSAEHQGLHH